MKKVLVLVFACLASTVMFAQTLPTHYQVANSVQLQAFYTKLNVMLEIDGEVMRSTELEIGVFDEWGELCLGAKRPVYRAATDQYIYMLQMKGYKPEYHEVTYYTFKVYDHATGTELDLNYVGETYQYLGNVTINSVTAPILHPFVSNSTGEEYTLDITGHAGGDNYWYFISSPIGTVDVDGEKVDGLLTETAYDLYLFDQSGEGDETHPFLEWRNYEAGEFTQLEAGKGYLYANQEGTQLKFTGTGYTTETGTASYPLDYDAESNYPGMNLMGNPFAGPATVDKAEFYILDPESGEYVVYSGAIAPMQGILVEAEGAEETVTFTAAAGGAGGDDPEQGDEFKKVAVRVNGNGGHDAAYIRFGQGHGLTKYMLNPAHTRVSLQKDDTEYAVVYAEEMGEMPVNFKAEKDGVYTLSFAGENVMFNYLHLIDNMTGADVDLNASPVYSFEARTTDYASRFKLVYATGESGEDFAFYSNGSFIVSNEGEATLQVVDVTGRILKNETISGSASVNVSAATGVYMLRLINGDNVKVQKVVVK